MATGKIFPMKIKMLHFTNLSKEFILKNKNTFFLKKINYFYIILYLHMAK